MSIQLQLNSKKRIFGFDLIRAIAILMVMISHGNPIIDRHFPLLKQFYGGFWGVEIFFVLSGFLIGSIFIKSFEENQRFSSKDVSIFWKRRWYRTLPNYYLVLLVIIAVHLFIPLTGKVNIYEYFFFVQNIISSNYILFGESWSLAVEEWFYLLLPLSVYVLSLLKVGKHTSLILTILIFIVGSTLMRIHRATYVGDDEFTWNAYIRTVVICRLDSLMFGVAMAYLKIYYPLLWYRYHFVLFWTGAVLLIISIYITYTQTIGWYTKTFYFTVYHLAFALLIPVFNTLKNAPCWLSFPITYISLISYSLYLLHNSFIIGIIHYLYPFEKTSVILSLSLYIVYWGISFLLSTLLYLYYEKPLTNLRDKPK